MGLGETSLKWRCSFFLMFVGFIFYIAAIASTNFAYAELVPNKLKHIGLWDICDDTQTYSCTDMIYYMLSIDRGTDWVYGCRAMAVLGLILEFGTILTSLWMAYMASGIHIGSLITAIADFVSVIISLIGGFVFTFNAIDVLQETLEMDADPSWSFAVFLIGQSLFFLGGVLQVYEACTAD
ncbi:hypothetical protein BsWGS_24346 [Bradybaena similaris]